MTKSIGVLIILAVAYLGYLVFQQWEKAEFEHDNARKLAAATVFTPESLPGMPYQPAPAYMAYPPFREPGWRYEMWSPQKYYRGHHFWLDQL